MNQHNQKSFVLCLSLGLWAGLFSAYWFALPLSLSISVVGTGLLIGWLAHRNQPKAFCGLVSGVFGALPLGLLMVSQSGMTLVVSLWLMAFILITGIVVGSFIAFFRESWV